MQIIACDLICAQKAADYLHTNHTNIVITKQEYLDAIPEGDALKAQLKSHNKEQKARHAKIYQYMRENNVMSTDLGGVTFEREEKTTVPAVSLKTLEEIIENPAVVEAYKRDYAKTKESLKVRKPKRQRVSE